MFTVEPFSCKGSALNELIVAIFQKTGAFLSIVGSSLIASDVAKKVRNGRETDPYQRIMVGLSTLDVLVSFFVLFLGTWMVPKETGWLWAVGNTSSCSAQGFFALFGGFGELVSLNLIICICLVITRTSFSSILSLPKLSSIQSVIPGSDITQYPAVDCFWVETRDVLEEGGKADALHHHCFCPRPCHHSFGV